MGENKRYKKSEKYKGVYQRKDGSWFYTIKKTFTSAYHQTKEIEVELFTWEKLDLVEKFKKEFK